MPEMDTTSFWMESSPFSRYPALARNLDVDVVVVGAGITGLTAAYLLKRAGRTVAVVERGHAGGVDTMYTTAHVTCVTDAGLAELANSFGRDHAQAAWDAGLAAIDQIDAIVGGEGIACDWTWVPGHKHATLGRDPDREYLQQEAALATELGFDAEYVESVPMIDRPGIVYEGQAKFHPRKYLSALAKIIDGDGSHIFEHTPCEEVADDPLSIRSGAFRIQCTHLVLATHTPLMGKTHLASAMLLQTKLYLYTSYVVGGRLPRESAPEALFWDTADPYNYVRIDRRRDHDYVIFGGADHKTGQVSDTLACYRQVERAAKALLPKLDVTHGWSGQVIETNDGLPFIGETSPGQFTATGFGGNGMTFGTLGAMMARDAILGKRNPWSDLFDVGRTKIKGGAWDYLKENADYPYYLIRDLLTGAKGRSRRAVRRGEGRILELNGQRVAAFRDDEGKLTLLSPTCTHLGCQVAWNSAEQTWDCPCHGSRFKATGQVMSGPAESPLGPAAPEAQETIIERVGRR
jgi:glycine/D-amino acid oxidase-like deaminating enzyme/nitrite reductase/ring-hydroxylating ferredoxin subunit